ncbi:MAG TPA: fluoride efflux transporter CrcB [Acidimicrobiales bacterium]|nr:fluoride efflux transporter CrcB [Acidimicrobiales bacterium]
MRIAMVAAAGALGTVVRYAVGVRVGVQSFPWATLAVNTVGSFALGVVLVAGPSRWPRDLVVAVSVGFLGGFTTFSTFGYESQTLLREGRAAASAAYVVGSVCAGVAAAALGYTAGGSLRR